MVNNQPSASLTLFTFWFTVFCSDNELFFFWITPCFFPGLTAHLLFFSPKQMGCTPSLWLLPWQNANGSACSQRWSSAQRTSWGVAWVLTVSPVCCSSIQSLWSHDPEGVHQEPQGASSHRISVWVTHTHTHTQLQSRLLQRLSDGKMEVLSYVLTVLIFLIFLNRADVIRVQKIHLTEFGGTWKKSFVLTCHNFLRKNHF